MANPLFWIIFYMIDGKEKATKECKGIISAFWHGDKL